MTLTEILTEIKSARLENEVLQWLVLDRLETLSQKSEKLAEAKATLRLIGKITKDKTVKTILSDEPEESDTD